MWVEIQIKFEIAAGIKRYFHTLTIQELNFFSINLSTCSEVAIQS